MDGVIIRLLEPGDVLHISSAFTAIGWNKPAAQYERYLADQHRGERVVLVAFQHQTFAGYLTVVWQSAYPPFRDAQAPEIVDFNVLPHIQRRGIGSQLMAEAEQRIAERSPVVGIRVGLYAAYGAAQRLYAKRGYVPDGLGLVSHDRHVAAGEIVTVDDGLVLCFTKSLDRLQHG